MAVPTPPTAGEPIAEAWGDVVHDAVVAMDIQAGKQQITIPSGAEVGVAVVFPRPFAAPPVVVIGTESAGGVNGRIVIARKSAITATGFTCWLQSSSGAAVAGSVTQTTDWIAYGPRA
jgi:hypothetical protein